MHPHQESVKALNFLECVGPGLGRFGEKDFPIETSKLLCRQAKQTAVR